MVAVEYGNVEVDQVERKLQFQVAIEHSIHRWEALAFLKSQDLALVTLIFECSDSYLSMAPSSDLVTLRTGFSLAAPFNTYGRTKIESLALWLTTARSYNFCFVRLSSLLRAGEFVASFVQAHGTYVCFASLHCSSIIAAERSFKRGLFIAGQQIFGTLKTSSGCRY